MTSHRLLSLLLAVQLLLTQLLACRCHVGADGPTASPGVAPHVHLPTAGVSGCCCSQPHADEATDPSWLDRHPHDPDAVYPLADLPMLQPGGENELPDGGLASLSPCPVEVSPCLAEPPAVLLCPLVLGQPPGPLYLRLRTLLI